MNFECDNNVSILVVLSVNKGRLKKLKCDKLDGINFSV